MRSVPAARSPACDLSDSSPIATACLLVAIEPAAGGPQHAVQNSVPADFFVSPKGNDTWTGKRAEPGEDDGPFATVDRAREAVRAQVKTLNRPRPVRVVLRAGMYYLDMPLGFGPEDSGSRDAPVVYAAAPGEKVTLSGGHRLQGGRWAEVNGRKAWAVDIPEAKVDTWRFRQLFVNGERRPRTRLPKKASTGSNRCLATPATSSRARPGGSSTPRATSSPAGATSGTWRSSGSRDGWTAGCRSRASTRQSRTVTFDRPSLFALLSGDRPGPYWVENVVEALNTPGQWYLDRPQEASVGLPPSRFLYRTLQTTPIIALDGLLRLAVWIHAHHPVVQGGQPCHKLPQSLLPPARVRHRAIEARPTLESPDRRAASEDAGHSQRHRGPSARCTSRRRGGA